MSFRTVIVKNRCKLEYSLNYMVYRTADQEKRILLDEISTIMIETNMACLTSALISEVSQRNIKLIFCDSKSNPICETLSYYGSYDSFSKLVKQYNFDKEIVAQVWSVIVKEKIVGFITGEILSKKEWYTVQLGTINNLFVLEEYRGKGIGKKLMETMMDAFKEKGINNFELYALNNNENALKFYEKLGFKKYNVQMLYQKK